MTKIKTTKRALFASILSLFVCVSMLIGSTFAWFTDTATTGVNKIQAGNLDVDLYYGVVEDDAISYTEEVDNETMLFNEEALWEPGYTEVAYLKVENVGTLALKALFTVNFSKQVKGVSVEGNEIELSKYLMYDLVEIEEDEFYATRDAARTAAEAGAKHIATEQNEINLEADADPLYYALVVYMPEEVGNEANYRGDTVPSIDLGVTLIAAQDTVEDDSWNNQYDKDAGYPSSIENDEGLKEALLSSDDVTIKNGNYTLPLSVPANKNLTVEGGDFAVTGTEESEAAFLVGKGASLTISSSDITATEYNVAIKAQDNADIVLNEGTYATTGIQVISAGSNTNITITGGEYSGLTLSWPSLENNMNISGGTFNMTGALIVADHPGNIVAISGGTFNIPDFDAGTLVNFVITGGSFNIDPKAYVDTTAYDVTFADGMYTVTAK